MPTFESLMNLGDPFPLLANHLACERHIEVYRDVISFKCILHTVEDHGILGRTSAHAANIVCLRSEGGPPYSFDGGVHTNATKLPQEGAVVKVCRSDLL